MIRDNPALVDSLIAIHYKDGFTGYILMLSQWITETNYDNLMGLFPFAYQAARAAGPTASAFVLHLVDPFGHFAKQLYLIDRWMNNIKNPPPAAAAPAPPVIPPAERTLLTTGILEAIMMSRSLGGIPVTTDYMSVSYRATDHYIADGNVPDRVYRTHKITAAGRFDMIDEVVASGYKPLPEQGLKWLQTNGCKTFLHIFTGEAGAVREQVRERGIAYHAIDGGAKDWPDQFRKIFVPIVHEEKAHPLYVLFGDGRLAFRFWFLYFSLREGSMARGEAKARGLGSRPENGEFKGLCQVAEKMMAGAAQR
jgi:hypothetical protein